MLSLLCAGLIGLTRLTPQPSRAESVLALNPCVLPCLYGITPGQTSRDEVLGVIKAASHDGAAHLSLVVVDAEERRAIDAVSFDQNEIVTSTLLSNDGRYVNIGQLSDLMLVGLMPHHLFLYCYPGSFAAYLTFGENDQVQVGLKPGDQLAPDTPILVVKEPAANTADDFTFLGDCAVVTNWLGFAPLWKYQATLP